jgi:hypothetical protein
VDNAVSPRRCKLRLNLAVFVSSQTVWSKCAGSLGWGFSRPDQKWSKSDVRDPFASNHCRYLNLLDRKLKNLVDGLHLMA